MDVTESKNIHSFVLLVLCLILLLYYIDCKIQLKPISAPDTSGLHGL
jgi:hypothetical protein